MNLKALLLLPLCVALAGCGSVRDTLGLGRQVPDEFVVVDRPSLAIPPEFTLRPPQPGASRPQEVDLRERARLTTLGPSPTASTPPATSDLSKRLLSAAGADKAQPDIRATIDREAADMVVSNRPFVDYLLNWRGNQQPPATVVDPKAEQARIEANQAAGKLLNAGPTPTIERRGSSGFLGL